VTLLGWNNPKCKMPPKRDIVDPFFHASRAFGHKPALGVNFPITWELESLKQSNKIKHLLLVSGDLHYLVRAPVGVRAALEHIEGLAGLETPMKK